MSGNGHLACGIGVTPEWFVSQIGAGHPNSFVSSLDEVAAYGQAKRRAAFAAASDIGLGCSDPEPVISPPQHDGRTMIAMEYGAPYPRWDEVSGTFVPLKGSHPWGHIATLRDVEQVPLPTWEDNPLIEESATKWQEYVARVGPEAAGAVSLSWTHGLRRNPSTGRQFYSTSLPSFLDLGGFLMDHTEFMICLAAEPELAHALLEKISAVALSYTEKMGEIYDRPIQGWGSLGGDNSCLVAAEMYRDYAMRYDRLARERFGNLPRNLHSCGASGHLYEVWGEYPEREQIWTMQTRALPTGMKPLRQALPDTYLEITIHPPEFEFERETPDHVRELAWQLAEDAGFRGARFNALVSRLDDQCRSNAAVFFETVRDINERPRTGKEAA